MQSQPPQTDTFPFSPSTVPVGDAAPASGPSASGVSGTQPLEGARVRPAMPTLCSKLAKTLSLVSKKIFSGGVNEKQTQRLLEALKKRDSSESITQLLTSGADAELLIAELVNHDQITFEDLSTYLEFARQHHYPDEVTQAVSGAMGSALVKSAENAGNDKVAAEDIIRNLNLLKADIPPDAVRKIAALLQVKTVKEWLQDGATDQLIAIPPPRALPPSESSVDERIHFVETAVEEAAALFEKADPEHKKTWLFVGPEWMFIKQSIGHLIIFRDTDRQIDEIAYQKIKTALKKLSIKHPRMMIFPGTISRKKSMQRESLEDYIARHDAGEPCISKLGDGNSRQNTTVNFTVGTKPVTQSKRLRKYCESLIKKQEDNSISTFENRNSFTRI